MPICQFDRPLRVLAQYAPSALTRRAILQTLDMQFVELGTLYAKARRNFFSGLFAVVLFLVLWLFDIPLSGFPFRDKPIFPALRFKEPKILVQLLCTANAKSFGFFGH